MAKCNFSTFQSLFPQINIPQNLKGPDLDFFMLKYYDKIIGIDEVGRGCLAGPVMSCAIILKPAGIRLEGLNDSKKLNEKERHRLFPQILEHTEYCGIGISFVPEIDEINILEATKLSMYRAIYNLALPKNLKPCLLVDGLYLTHNFFTSFKLIKGDSKSPSIMAASIIAKVLRDKLMEIYDKYIPDYGFKKHKGYGTPYHKSQINKDHYSPLHRKSFAPLKFFLSEKFKDYI